MPEIVSMKLKKKSKKERDAQCCPSHEDQEQFPWGMRMHLGNEELEKMPKLGNRNVGDEIFIVGRAKIVEKSSNEEQTPKGTKERKRMEIQVTDFGAYPKSDKSFKETFDEITS